MPFSPDELADLRSFAEEWMIDAAQVLTHEGDLTLQADLTVTGVSETQVYSGKCRVRVASSNQSSAEGEQVFTVVDVSFPHTVVADVDDLVRVTTVGDPYLLGDYVITQVHAQGQHAVRKFTCRKLSDNRLRDQ